MRRFTCKLFALSISLFASAFGLNAQETVQSLNNLNFKKYWMIESESPDYQVKHLGDTLEIVSPKGLTLWHKEQMKGNVVIEYDACVMDEGRPEDRLSDLNCFWMASDPKSLNNIKKRMAWRNGVFANSYSLQLYYVGFGGNHNTTTRFRRYDGDEAGIADKEKRPAILKEYTDEAHLLKPNKWYHIRLESLNGQVTYTINGERLVDFRDARPLNEGWFGFRTTQSRTRIANFRYTCTPIEGQPRHITLRWIGDTPQTDMPNTWGVPFEQGSVQPHSLFSLMAKDSILAYDFWPLAYWPDGSVKWGAFATVVPGGADSVALKLDFKRSWTQKGKKKKSEEPPFTIHDSQFIITTGPLTAHISREGGCLFDSLIYRGTKVADKARLICQTREKKFSNGGEKTFRQGDFESLIKACDIERSDRVRTVVKVEGVHTDGRREWLPFVVRLYFYQGSEQVKMVHTLLYDGDAEKDFISGLGVRFDVPLRDEVYNRHVAFTNIEGGVWSEPVQPLVGRRVLSLNRQDMQQVQMRGERVPSLENFNGQGQTLIREWAAWDGYRLSQLTADAFSVRKRATDDSPWIGTLSDHRGSGLAFIGDTQGGLAACLHEFWQSYPSTLEINGARSPMASLTLWLWSPEADVMDLRHYDKVAHGLNSSYEDVQEGLSTPYGIGRTSTLMLTPYIYKGKEEMSRLSETLTSEYQLACLPEYMHDRRAFGVWSLPKYDTPLAKQIEKRLDDYIHYYQQAIEGHKWYGFWDYGDVMHAYDPARHSWRYDVGGFAWDNTELASNMWLWYMYLRTGRADIWQMAKAMSRHTSEVDVYHFGPNAGLGSRHNVSHWGCGAKEARVSQAAWNRFFYYLTGDERTGDLMTEVKDAEQKLYTLDPMRLAQPRSKYPSSAPARLRIGPDWLAYAGNWMTQWERTGDIKYRDMIIAGMKSICQMPKRIFQGPGVLGFDPATGIISYEGDTTLRNNNHLLSLMGGFEIVNEMNEMIPLPEWKEAWQEYTLNYSGGFTIPRLKAYAAHHGADPVAGEDAWRLFLRRDYPDAVSELQTYTVEAPQVLAPLLENPGISTNGVATWSLDAIYLQEVWPK